MHRCALTFISLGLIGAVLHGGSADEAVKGPPKEQAAKRAAARVEAIANRNKRPEVVRRRRICPSTFPLFPRNYDWEEDERVRKALDKLCEDTSEEVWEALVQKVEDKRYCVTSYSGSSGDVEFRSVGGICRVLAYERLACAFEKHLPSLPSHGCPIQLEEIQKDMRAWRNGRKDKSLYQLQIEVCEMAIRELPKLRTDWLLTEDAAKVRKEVEAEIRELRRTRKPIVMERPYGWTGGYRRREAERVREAYEKNRLEDFWSGVNR